MNKEIKEALEDFKNYTSGTGKTVRDFLQSYLDVQGFPEEIPTESLSGEVKHCAEHGNAIIHLCILAHLKEIEKIEDGLTAAYLKGVEEGKDKIKGQMRERLSVENLSEVVSPIWSYLEPYGIEEKERYKIYDRIACIIHAEIEEAVNGK